jgi:hypothetical protein
MKLKLNFISDFIKSLCVVMSCFPENLDLSGMIKAA